MNAPAPLLEAVSYAALHTDVLRRLAEARERPERQPQTLQALCDELGAGDRSNFNKQLQRLHRDGLIVRDDPDTPTGLRITAAGLQALTGIDIAIGEAGEADAAARMIEHGRLRLNPMNLRKTIVDQEISDLADSVEGNLHRGGVLTPLSVWPADGQGLYTIDAGDKRWRAVKLLIDQNRVAADFRLPCRVREPDAMDAAASVAFVSLTENGQRSGLSKLEEARGYRILVENTGWTPTEAAKRTGRDVRTVQEMLKVLREASPDDIAAHERGEMKWEELRDSVKKLTLTPLHALAVAELADRMDREDPALADDQGGPPWVEITLLPTIGGWSDLVARKILEFQAYPEAMARARTDDVKVAAFLRDAGFHADRDRCLYALREAALGAFEARDRAVLNTYSTSWLAPPPILEAAPAPDPAAPPGSAAPQPASSPGSAPEPLSSSEIAPPLEVEPQPVQGAAPTPARPDFRQQMILAEIAHKTTFDPAQIGSGLAGAKFVSSRLQTPEGDQLGVLIRRGWVEVHDGWDFDLVRLTDLGWAQLDPAGQRGVEVNSAMRDARIAAGVALAEREQLQAGKRYAFGPLNDATAAQAELTLVQPSLADLVKLDDGPALALVELAAKIVREGVEPRGKGYRGAKVYDYHLDRHAGVLVMAKLIGFANPGGDAQWLAYLTPRGLDWLRAHKIDPDAVSEADIGRFFVGAPIADGVEWASAFLNPKAAAPTGPAPRPAAAPGRASVPPASSTAATPTAGATARRLLQALAEAASPLLSPLNASARAVAQADPDHAYALTQLSETLERALRDASEFLNLVKPEDFA